jgi:hypothetical protein
VGSTVKDWKMAIIALYMQRDKKGSAARGKRYYYYYYYYYYEGGRVRTVHCSKGSQAVPARPSVEVRCRQGGSVMASGLLGCAEGKQVEFCLCLVGSGMVTFWYLLVGSGMVTFWYLLMGSGMVTFWYLL